jgi:hypothetical protein
MGKYALLGSSMSPLSSLSPSPSRSPRRAETQKSARERNGKQSLMRSRDFWHVSISSNDLELGGLMIVHPVHPLTRQMAMRKRKSPEIQLDEARRLRLHHPDEVGSQLVDYEIAKNSVITDHAISRPDLA